MYTFTIELADMDRGVYQTLDLRVACHPSETHEYLLTRVLAYCLECTEGIAFGKGLSEPNEPALTVRDLTGQLQAWIEVGTPDAGRLHKASKGSPRVAIYTHKDPATLVRQLSGERIHRADALELYAIDRELLAVMVQHLTRRMAFSLSVGDRQMYLTVGDTNVTAPIERHLVTRHSS
jgi:uncharacterized protein YaeQ